jgi:hypothetical protein
MPNKKTDPSVPYVIWQFEDVAHSLVLDRLHGVDDIFELVEGTPRAGTFPPDARFTPDPDFPNDMGLVDSFTNTYNLTVISTKLKEFIEDKHPEKVEYLPVTLLNHKSRPAGEYFILHPVDPVDALDIEQSGAEWDVVDETVIDSIQRIVLSPDKLDVNRQIFKLKHLYDVLLVHTDFAKAIDENGFTGIKWVNCENFSRGIE